MGSVSSIESCSMIDGPGIRTVVFLNECHLRCKYCHNPEMFLKGPDNISDEELTTKILKNKAYFKNGGGVTFSGGEPLLQVDFLNNVVDKLKEENIHISIDTAGVTNKNYKPLIDKVDLVLLDVKHTNKEGFKDLTKGDFSKAIEFRDYLVETKKNVWIRQVIVPGINDNINYLKTLKTYIKDLNVLRVDFLPFSKLCIDKYDKLNMVFPFENIESMDKNKCDNLYQEFLKL